MRKALVTSLALAATAALVVVVSASGRSTAPTASAAIPGCAKDKLGLVEDGTLTVGADNPAYPPWFGGDEKTKPWKVTDPYSGKGYESAVAYAIAKQLGFTKAQVKWTVVPFNNSYRPGKKPFDVYLTQVSYSPARAKAADMSKSYYFVNQSLVALKGTPIASAKSIAALKNYKLGAQIGTTSASYIENVIKPASSRTLRHERPGSAGAQGQVDRRDRRRHADGVLRHGCSDPERQGRRPPEDGRCARALRRSAPEGEQADSVREPGDQPTLAERDDQEAPEGVAPEHERRTRPEVVR